jgi:hypothetical protein
MNKFKPIFGLIFIIILTTGAGHAMPPQVKAQENAECPSAADLPPRLTAGLWAQVADRAGLAHNIREDATTQSAVLAQVPDGDIFRVVDGPRCAKNYVWWQVNYVGQTGWIAEGDETTGDYWLALLDGQEAPSTESESAPDTSGCQKPPEDYGRFVVNGEQLNARTLAMLDYAEGLYRAEGGILQFRRAVMQGSYNPGGVQASFGTHDGGGAVDLSVRSLKNFDVMTDEIAPMLRALRTAGFAAWLRETDSLYPGSPIHIHAIAIGDAELSEAARGQLDGTFGYFRGYNGLPQENNIPQPDTSGDMVLCDWMVEMGYTDLRGQ